MRTQEEIAAYQKAYQKEYRVVNREKLALRSKEYHAAHKEEHNIKSSAYYRANKTSPVPRVEHRDAVGGD